MNTKTIQPEGSSCSDSVPGDGALPGERAQGLRAAVPLGGGQPVNQQVEAEPAEGGPDGAVARRRGDVLHAVLEARGEVGDAGAQHLGLGQHQPRVEPGREIEEDTGCRS